MLDIESLSVDPVSAEEGTWANFMGAKLLIARHNCDKALQLRSKLALESWDKISKQDEEAEEISREINFRVMAEAILLGWEGITKGGKALKYTPEIGFEYLRDPRFRDLAQFVENYSLNRGNYREKAEQEVAESVKTSAAS